MITSGRVCDRSASGDHSLPGRRLRAAWTRRQALDVVDPDRAGLVAEFAGPSRDFILIVSLKMPM